MAVRCVLWGWCWKELNHCIMLSDRGFLWVFFFWGGGVGLESLLLSSYQL